MSPRCRRPGCRSGRRGRIARPELIGEAVAPCTWIASLVTRSAISLTLILAAALLEQRRRGAARRLRAGLGRGPCGARGPLRSRCRGAAAYRPEPEAVVQDPACGRTGFRRAGPRY